MAKPTPTKNRPIPTPPRPAEEGDAGRTNGHGQGVKNRQATAIRESEVLQSVAGLNLDAVSQDIATTQTEVQKSLADLSAKLVEKLQVLRKVEEAIGLKREDLKQLYDIEAAAVDLDDMMAKIEAQRMSWEEEQARKQREFAEQQSERNKQWARSEEEHQYKVGQERRKAQDDFAQKMLAQERANKDKQEAQEKSWAERELELKKREKELEDLRTQAAAFPEEKRKAENAAVAVATNSVKKEYETKAILASKDAETVAKLATQEVASLKEQIARQTAQLAEIKAQLDRAHADVKEISAKALESASGRSAMEAMQKVLEKEQTSKPGK